MLHVAIYKQQIIYKDMITGSSTADGHNEAEFGMSWCAGFGADFYNAYFQVPIDFCCRFDWSTAKSSRANG